MRRVLKVFLLREMISMSNDNGSQAKAGPLSSDAESQEATSHFAAGDLAFIAVQDFFIPDFDFGIQRLCHLLLDPKLYGERRVCIKRLLHPNGARRQSVTTDECLGHALDSVRDLLPELWWLGTCQLVKALETKRTTPERVARLTVNLDAMAVARRVLEEGVEELDFAIRSCQADAWNWIRDQITSGRLRDHAGQHVAVWKREQREELIYDKSFARAAARAAEEWMLPPRLIAVELIDADEG